MILYLMITALTVFLAFFVNSAYGTEINQRGMRNKNRQGLLNAVLLTAIFVVLFALSAFRIGIGSDYWVYRDNFLRIVSDSETIVPYEIGFKAVVYVLQSLFGYDNYRIVFAVMAFLTCGFFIKGLVASSDWFMMSYFLFMANGFYFMSFSNVRYYFALAVCIYALQYVFQKDYVRFIVWILFAALFHKSVLLVIPVYLIAYYLKWNKKTIWLIPACCGVLFFGKPLVRKLIFLFYPFYEGDVILDVESVSYINIARCLAILVFACIYYKKAISGNRKAEMLFNLNLFAGVLYTFGYYIPETSRLCYFLVIGNVFLIPIILQAITEKRQKWFFLIAIVLAFSGYLVVFIQRSREATTLLLPYMTWLFT